MYFDEMCEPLEVARILDVNETLLKARCRGNSAIPSLSIMARIRLPQKIDTKPATTPLKVEQRVSSTPTKMSSSLSSSSSDSYPSSPETSEPKFPLNFNEIISGVKGIMLASSDEDKAERSSDENGSCGCEKNIVESDDEKSEKFGDEDEDCVHTLKFVYKRNVFAGGDEKSTKDSDEDDNEESLQFAHKFNILKLGNDKSDESSENDDEDDEYGECNEGLIQRGPVRPQMHPVNRPKPYVESAHQWPSAGSQPPPSENSTDYDTSAKAILTDQEYKQKIDLCLDQLSDMGQERSVANSLSPGDSDFGGLSSYSPQQPNHWQQADQSPSSVRSGSSSTYFVPSITVGDSESTILEVLSRHGLQRPVYQPVQAQTPDYNSGASTAACDNYPESPASSYNACATSASRPESRASSRAQSPGSNNGGCASTGNFLNLLASPLGSPQVSPQNFRSHHRPSSSSSSSQSYCETPSPANYQNPLEQHVEEKLGDHMMTRMPAWRDSFESSDTLVNSLDSSELRLQLVEEVIRGDMKDQPRPNDMQVVPNCRTSSTVINSSSPAAAMPSSENYAGLDNETTDDLTNTLLRFVGSEQTIPSHRKVEARDNSSTTSGYSSGSSSNEARKLSQDGRCLPLDQPLQTSFLGSLRSPPRQQQPQPTVYQHSSMNLSPAMGTEALHFPTSPVELMGRHAAWKSFPPERNAVLGNLTSSRDFNEFQIPETVTSYSSQMTKTTSKSKSNGGIGSGGERTIAPWPSLNLPSTRACERLKEVTDPREVERAMKTLLKQPLEKLAKTDDDGDTMLMCLAGNPVELSDKLAWLAPLVERMSSYENCLATLNHRGEDALYLAAMNCPQMAFVAGYLAAAFLQKKIDVGQRLYRSRGDTIVHALAAKGDAHGGVLAELLSLKTAQGNSVFDLSKRNYDGRTALHVAVEAHESLVRNKKTISIGTVRLLMESGADPLVREVRCGDTALHLAVSLSADPALVKMLLIGRGHEAVNVPNYNGNTPMHMIAAMSERTTLERQTEVCYALMHAGARTNITNRQGKTALALVSADRKDLFRRIFHKKS